VYIKFKIKILIPFFDTQINSTSILFLFLLLPVLCVGIFSSVLCYVMLCYAILCVSMRSLYSMMCYSGKRNEEAQVMIDSIKERYTVQFNKHILYMIFLAIFSDESILVL